MVIVVIVWWGCEGFGGSKSIILDSKSRLNWYLIDEGVLRDFLRLAPTFLDQDKDFGHTF